MGWGKNDTWVRYLTGIEVDICLRVMCYTPSAMLGDESFELSLLHFYNCPNLGGYNGCGKSFHLGLSNDMSIYI